MEKQLWNRSLIASDDRKFVDAKIFDETAGKELVNKYRMVQRLVSERFDGTTMEFDDLVRKIAIPRQRSHATAVADVILRGLKELPGSEKKEDQNTHL